MAELPEANRPKTADQVPEWTTAPVLERRTVLRGQVRVTAAGPEGESCAHQFCAPELVGWEGQTVRVAFDPFLVEAGATIVEARAPRVICQATFTGARAGRAAVDAVKAVRDSVRRELRVLLPNQPVRREVLVRQGGEAPSPTPALSQGERENGGADAITPAVSRGGARAEAFFEEDEAETLARLEAAEAELRRSGVYVPA
jgi:hypothetical protein